MTQKKKVILALQGGGAYGAFTWGVIDRLLQDDRIEIVGVTGSSSGALNAIALADGLDRGGREEARKTLDCLWDALEFNDFWEHVPGGKTLTKVGGAITRVDFTKRLGKMSPKIKSSTFALFNTLASSNASKKLRDLRLQEKLREVIDFDAFRSRKNGLNICVNATDVVSQSQVIFDRKTVSADAIAASCAVPGFLPPVDIDGRPHYDGAASANPEISTFRNGDVEDILFIKTVPIPPEDVLKNPPKDVSPGSHLAAHFLNSSIRRNVQDIAQSNETLDKNPAAAKQLGIKRHHTHLIHDNGSLPYRRLGMLDFHEDFIGELKELGREAADEWLKTHFDDLGNKSTYTAEYTRKAHTPQVKPKNPKP